MKLDDVNEMVASEALAEYNRMLDLPKRDWMSYGSSRATALSERLDGLLKASGLDVDDDGNVISRCVAEMPLRDEIAIGQWCMMKANLRKPGFISL